MSGRLDVRGINGCRAIRRHIGRSKHFQWPLHLPVTHASKRVKRRQRARVRCAKKAASIEAPAESGTRVIWTRAAHFIALLVGLYWKDE